MGAPSGPVATLTHHARLGMTRMGQSGPLEDPELVRPHDSFEAGVHSQTGDDRADVVPDGLGGDAELLRDRRRRMALREVPEHVHLARCDGDRVE